MRASRLISLVLLLQARGMMTAAELAVELEVSERTVHRDVLALSAAGVPVYAERGRGGGYRLLDGYRTRLTGLDRAEAQALFLSGVPAALREMGLEEVAATARLKAAAALSPGLRDAPATAAQRFHLDAPGWFAGDSPPPSALTPLARAVWDDRRVTAVYRDAERVLEPYGLVLKAGVWYLAARLRERYLIFRVHRFGDLTVLDERFERDAGFDLAAFWAERSAAFARSLLREVVTLRLSERGVRMLRHVADPAALDDALASLEPDGTVRLAVESLEVAYAQVLRFGPEAEVLGPQRLRAMVADAAARTAALYDER
ncbi:Predicted DNA-binding transcriptional regulator YafY, contains an HTH and WYL domains [Nonomuraea maritima]|uniref:Predicted DNA-binding transcriptional regulator YafY, contains an HTH and WYL domains n=1 Tax=Nonomuraea maritima TaxID=683260 RepID=A0A1G9LIM0_9ACTN|nr:WYL domain-containing protein [Nonomuraea maritima]SDL61734.1 Predicted DNA-binding transcriptional regulator YafY, contains an HTH and WYL domains [Nonomuraea maritima]